MKIDAFLLPTGDTAAQWTGDSGARYQVVGLGTAGVLFGVQRTPGEPWVTMPIDEPTRFGHWATVKQMQQWATRFTTEEV